MLNTKKHSKETKRKMSKAKKGNQNALGYKHSEEHNRKISEACKGRIVLEEHKRKLSKNSAKYWLGKTRQPFTKETKQKMSEAQKGKKLSEETKLKMRVASIKRIEKTTGQCSPNYNPDSISIIENYGQKYGYNFQHAENGGEVCIDGYFPDGVDMDKKIIIEIDEKHHFNADSSYKQRDINRQKYLERLGYEFIRIRMEN